MPRSPSRASMLARLLALTALLAPPASVAAQESYAVRCGVTHVGHPPGFEPIPSGDSFCPLLADPKGQRSFVSYLRGSEDFVARDVASVGVSDQFGLFRVNGARAGDGVQVSLAGSVFAQFDLGAPSFDLVNADYIIGLPVTVRRGGFSARVRVYHQSSHLGDEFLLRGDSTRPVERENLSFESVEALLSQDFGPLRVYGGGEWLFNRSPDGLERSIAHGGLELRTPRSQRFGNVGRARFVAAVDLKSVAEQDWRTAVSARTGIEVGRAREDGDRGRRWSLLFEYYDGPSPYGQFYARDVRLTGLGLHFVL